jgi:hypothetical protein
MDKSFEGAIPVCYHLPMDSKKFDSPTAPGGRPRQVPIPEVDIPTKPGLPIPLEEPLLSQGVRTLNSFPSTPGRDEAVLPYISPEERERVSQQFSVLFSKIGTTENIPADEVTKEQLKKSFVYARFGRYLTTEALKDWCIKGIDAEITKRVINVISLLLKEEEEEEREEAAQFSENASKFRADEKLIKVRLAHLIEDLIIRSEERPEYFLSAGFTDDMYDLLEMDLVKAHPQALLEVLGELSLKLPHAWGLHLIRLEHAAGARLYRELFAFLKLNQDELTAKPEYLREELRELRKNDLFSLHPRALKRALARLRSEGSPQEKSQAVTVRPLSRDADGLMARSRAMQVDAIEAMLKDEK